MGEMLRAVMEASCVTSKPVFYNLAFPVSSNTSATPFQIGGSLQCKSDRYFLMTGISLIQGFTAAGILGGGGYTNVTPYYETISGAFLQVFRSNNNDSIYSNTMPMININDNLANFMTLPEYILWEPNEVIGATCTGFGNKGGIRQYQQYAVLTGIEYLMPT